MRTRIVVVVLAGVGVLSGCRDFSVPSPGNMGPLQVSQSSLHVAPQETVEIQVRGGKPPYTVARPGSSGSDYVGFSLSSESGGWAYLDGDQAVAYTAGQNGGGIDDTFVVRDKAGAKVDVKVSIGAPLALEIGDGTVATPVVHAGGTIFLGASGGKPPYLFGLASAPSDGFVDTVSGRYRAGAIGCTADTVEVRDAVGATALGKIDVACPPMSASPDQVVAALPADPQQNGTQQMIFVTTHGSTGGTIEIPGIGGAGVGIPLPGTPVAAAVPRGAAYAVVAVDVPPGNALFTNGVHVFRVRLFAGSTPEDLFVDDGGVTYPVSSPNVQIVTDEAFSGSLSSQVIVELTNGTQQYVNLVDAQNFQIPQVLTTVPAGETSSVTAPVPVGPGQVGWIHLATANGATTDAQWFAGTTIGVTAGTGQITLGLDQIIAVAGGFDVATGAPVIAAVGTTNGDPSSRTVRFLDFAVGATGGISVTVRPETVTLPPGTALIGSGAFNGSLGRQFFVVDPQGGTQILFDDGLGYTSLPLSWQVPASSTGLLVTDVTGAGHAEALVTGGPGGRPATFVDPGALPVVAPASRGIYGVDYLGGGEVTTRPGRTGGPAIVAVATGMDASGAPVRDSSGAVVIPGGADVGDPITLPIGPAGTGVTAIAAARLQTPSSGVDPEDVVAALDDGTLHAITSEHEGLLDPEAPVPDASGSAPLVGASWLASAPLSDDPSREAVLAGTPTAVRAVTSPGGTSLQVSPETALVTFSPVGRYLDAATVPTSVPAYVQVATGGTAIDDLSVDSTGNITLTQPLAMPQDKGASGTPYVVGPGPFKGNGFVILVSPTSLGTVDPIRSSAPCSFVFSFSPLSITYAGKTPDGAGYVFYLLHDDGLTVSRVVVVGAGLAVLVRDVSLSMPGNGLVAGDVVGSDGAVDLVAEGRPLTVLPGLPGVFDAGGTALACQ